VGHPLDPHVAEEGGALPGSTLSPVRQHQQRRRPEEHADGRNLRRSAAAGAVFAGVARDACGMEEAYERKDLPGPGDEDRHLHRLARYPGMPSPLPLGSASEQMLSLAPCPEDLEHGGMVVL
jgi:hypothetical protein